MSNDKDEQPTHPALTGKPEATSVTLYVCQRGACQAPASGYDDANIEVISLQTGERKEGAYYSVFTFLLKASSGVMAMITGFTLTYVGFVPNDPAPSELVRLAIKSLNSLPPLVSLLIGAIMLVGFGLTAEKHAEVRRALDVRRATTAPRSD